MREHIPGVRVEGQCCLTTTDDAPHVARHLIFLKNEKNNFTKIEGLCLYYLKINQINDQIKKSITYLDNRLDFPLIMIFNTFPVLKHVAYISRAILLVNGILGKLLVTKRQQKTSACTDNKSSVLKTH